MQQICSSSLLEKNRQIYNKKGGLEIVDKIIERPKTHSYIPLPHTLEQLKTSF
jgi:hypothetical protein